MSELQTQQSLSYKLDFQLYSPMIYSLLQNLLYGYILLADFRPALEGVVIFLYFVSL